MIQTDDIFLGAFGLVRGGQLAGIEVRGFGSRRIAVFRIDGPGMEELEREFHRGPSLVDLRLLKSEVRRLKDVAFEAIRREERKDHVDRDQGWDRGDSRSEPTRARRR